MQYVAINSNDRLCIRLMLDEDRLNDCTIFTIDIVSFLITSKKVGVVLTVHTVWSLHNNNYYAVYLEVVYTTDVRGCMHAYRHTGSA